MNIVKNKLDKILSLENLYSLYLNLGDSIKTNIDIKNLNYEYLSINNSISLLIKTKFIGIRFGRYSKKNKSKYTVLVDFKNELFNKIVTYYSEELESIFSRDVFYENISSSYFIKRNAVVLNLSGLLMLLDGLDVIEIIDSNIYIKNQTLLSNFHKTKSFTSCPVTIFELKNHLILKDKLGVEAEVLALDYEKSILQKQGIYKMPQIISSLDISAGYDIVSFLNNESTTPDKFIEVKSCSDNHYKFYMSRNEIKTARSKSESYYIYLYNRKTKKFRIIQNPHNKIINNDSWAKEAEIIEIHSIV